MIVGLAELLILGILVDWVFRRLTVPGSVAVLSILLTAPVGAWAIAFAGERVLEVAPPAVHDARDAAIESEGTQE